MIDLIGVYNVDWDNVFSISHILWFYSEHWFQSSDTFASQVTNSYYIVYRIPVEYSNL